MNQEGTIDTLGVFADFWRHDIGANVIPVDTRKKETYETWKEWQDKPIPQELHDRWKTSGAFSNGIAIILGKVWHSPLKKDLYLIGIDLDNQKAIEEVAIKGLEDLARHVIVEQHDDDSTKAHILLYSRKPFPKKSSDKTSISTANKIQSNEIPAVEVKGLGSHGILFVSPSIHKNGYPYEIIGTKEPEIVDDFAQHLDNIFKKYNIQYLDATNDNDNDIAITPIEDLFKPDYIVLEGHNRHEALMRAMESLIVRNSSILTLDNIKEYAKDWNIQHCSPPLDDKELEKQWKCALKFVSRKNRGEREQCYQYYQQPSNNTAITGYIILDPPPIPGGDYAEFVIKIIKKTVKQEDSLVRQIFYSALSSYTKDPINLGIIAPTSEGKTYPVIETLKLFPKEDVWLIGSMSTKLLVRQKGVLVDENNEPINPAIKELKELIKKTDNSKEKDKANNRLQELYENSRTLIDLGDKILVFLEPPQHDLWNLLKPILSHDSKEIEFPFVDKTERGLIPRRVVVRGWPSCIFCSARDESNWPVWPEIQSRFLITSPNMIPEKYQESNLLVAQRRGLPALVQQKIIVSNEDVRLTKNSILYLKQEIKKLSTDNNNNYDNSNTPVWIPYSQYLAEVLPSDKGTDTRAIRRIFSFLNIIPLAKSNLRIRLVYGMETLVTADLQDLGEVLHITQNLSGIPAYKMKFFNEVFYSLYEKNSNQPLTTKELCEFYRTRRGKAIDSDSMKKKYLNELRNNGIIGEEDSPDDKRQKIFIPLVESSSTVYLQETAGCNNKLEISNYKKEDVFDNFLRYSRITLPKNCRNIPEDWLIFEILALAKCRFNLDHFEGCLADFLNQSEEMKFIDKANKGRMSVREFVEQYEKSFTLNRYFRRARFQSYDSNIFGNIKFIQNLNTETCEKLSMKDNILQFDNLATRENSDMERSITEVVATPTTIPKNDIMSIRVEDFFYDDPKSPWQPLPEHGLEESPCYSIIVKDEINSMNRSIYKCKLHLDCWYIDLKGIEYHCRNHDPDKHKTEILKMLDQD
jgi:hypothetical protein